MKKEKLIEWVKPYNNDDSHPYYRPFVVQSKDEKYDIFLAGINPATPIYRKDIDLNLYIDLLTDYAEFYKMYNKVREGNSKPKMSRTRLGITSFVNEIQNRTNEKVLETNVVPYPTKNKKILKQTDSGVIAHALSLFHAVLLDHSPGTVIIYSKGSLEYFVKVLYENKMIDAKPSTKLKMSDLENSSGPFLEFTYPTGKQCSVFVCRHFMYYGKEGKTYSVFRDKVINHIKNNS